MKRPLQAARHMQTSPALDSILHVLNPPLIKKLKSRTSYMCVG